MRALLLAAALAALPMTATAQDMSWSQNDAHYSGLICTDEAVARAIGGAFGRLDLRTSLEEPAVDPAYRDLWDGAIELHYCVSAPLDYQISYGVSTTPIATWWNEDMTLTLTRSIYFDQALQMHTVYAFYLGKGT